MKWNTAGGIRKKTLKTTALLIIISMTAEVLLLYYASSAVSLKENKNNREDSLANIASYFLSYIEEVDSIARDVNYNYYLQNYLSAAIEEEDRYTEPSGIRNMRDYEMSSKAFSNTFLERSDITSIMIFGKKKLLFYKSLYEHNNVIVDYEKQKWYQLAVENPQNYIVTGPNEFAFFSENDSAISLSREIQSYEDGSFLGVILINLNLNKIADICEIYKEDKDGFLCVTNEEGTLIYQQQRGEGILSLNGDDGNENLTKMTQADTTRVKIEGRNYFLIRHSIDEIGWNLYYVEPYSIVVADIIRNGLFLVGGMLIMLLITLFVLNKIIAGMIKPLERLQRHMERVSLENLNQQMPIESDDEIGKLSQNFNEMLIRVDSLKQELIREQEDKRKYELQALQAQINPHFLYNTLDSIIWMAETSDPNVVSMTEALARLFRISLNKGKEEILVRKELEHVENYLIIQQMRYANKFTFEILADPDTLDCRIIKLILQPIVENCIYHGVKKKKNESSTILIRTMIREEKLVLCVEDDGCGMTEEVCAKILSDEIQPENISGSGIGIKNVNERIKLHFGEEYGLHFFSELGKGTRVEYILPICREEEMCRHEK